MTKLINGLFCAAAGFHKALTIFDRMIIIDLAAEYRLVQIGQDFLLHARPHLSRHHFFNKPI